MTSRADMVPLGGAMNEAQKQPRCGICGRFAAKDAWGCWYFPCVSGNSIDGWEHA